MIEKKAPTFQANIFIAVQMFLWTFTRQLEGKVGFLKMPNSFDWELNPKNPVHDVIFKAMLRL